MAYYGSIEQQVRKQIRNPEEEEERYGRSGALARWYASDEDFQGPRYHGEAPGYIRWQCASDFGNGYDIGSWNYGGGGGCFDPHDPGNWDPRYI
ncbi:hypothetical protein Slin15195_G044330 [Septoria linicola]|uniref:Uncharacterized protein n=1 Tax=Septoria linicola TaxID=215465 RepID=A0A9Q9AN00_9PEZI|nr:hypothetical protein Slin14017_G047850 [Septoria linicola]USW51114.1 hypothetical protein Slin15195_G044330 [Septoria linicola]